MDDFVVPEGVVMVDTIGLSVKDVDPATMPKRVHLTGQDGKVKKAKAVLKGRNGGNSLEVLGVMSRREFRLEGSAAMHFQGHNIVSPGDMTMLSWAAIRAARLGLNLGINLDRAKEFVRGHGLDVTRVDTPVLLKKPVGIATAAAINGLALAGLLAGNNTSVYVGESVYFDQHSQISAMKIYDKLAQVSRSRGFDAAGVSNPQMLWIWRRRRSGWSQFTARSI
jgi:hypothetical protein